MLHLYGIPNCDTVKKARAWLAERGIACAFHDFKKEGVHSAELQVWCEALGSDKLLNRQGTTWRKLDAASQQMASDSPGAQQLMRAQPSLIKRPVVSWPDSSNPQSSGFTVGFDPTEWAARAERLS